MIISKAPYNEIGYSLEQIATFLKSKRLTSKIKSLNRLYTFPPVHQL